MIQCMEFKPFRQNDVGASLNGEVLNRQTYKTQDFIS